MARLADDTPMLLIYLQRIRAKSTSVPYRRALMEAEHRCKYYDQLVDHARHGRYRELALLIEALDIMRKQQAERGED